ncbi:LysR family transcriptional regulator [Aequorivita sp. H23M31]|uniref:LysR family transcriptional regulator n=1 Tax=Aequorivita ciconiae TaxID=2494375 RepID=A0A410G403_9FLAO|nr:LysR family transcriptional regulator [Aequorivita sp. H23M31]QAA82018.1 LysR family transcriptional regulator [Aequorivita sp. H23M31]
MDFRLKVFRTVAEQLSFTKAAKILFVSQPAVTKHINELEKHFGKALFNRHGNTISLTNEGEICLDYANKILSLYESLDREFIELDGNLPSKITLAASTTIAQYILPSLLSKFKSVHPEINVSLINQNSERIEALVLAKKTDLGLVEGNTNNPLLHYEPFLKDEIVLTCRASYRKFKSSELMLEDLLTLPIILREQGSGTRIVIEKAIEAKSLNLQNFNIQMELGSTESIKNYLLYSDSFAFLSIHSIARELKDRSLTIVDIKGLEILRTFQFVGLHGNYNPTSEWMKNYLINHYNLME